MIPRVLLLALLAFPAQAQHPHDWIYSHKNTNGASCCSGYDTSEVPYDKAIGKQVGDRVFLPRFGASVEVRIIHPAPPGQGLKAWATMTGCLFVPQGF